MESRKVDLPTTSEPPTIGPYSSLFSDEINKGLTVHASLGQDVIVIDANKVRLLLYKKYERLKAQREWTTPVGILLALVVTQVSADFKTTWNLSGPTWHAMFLISSILCAAWSLSCLWKAYQARGVNDIDEIVSELMKQQTGTGAESS